MDKAREAFERHQANLTSTDYEVLKAHFDNNEQYFGSRYNEGSLYERDWLIWESCWQSRQGELDELQRALKLKTRCSDFYKNSRKAHRALSRYRKQKIDELRKHSISLRDAAKSWSYTEREKNILISQADDIDRILGN